MWQYLANTVLPAPAAATEGDSSQSGISINTASAAPSFSWSRISSYVCEKGTDVAFELAPVEDDLAFLRISAVLAHLSVLVYSAQAGDIGQTSHVDLPLLGNLGTKRSVGCKMLHFR